MHYYFYNNSFGTHMFAKVSFILPCAKRKKKKEKMQK